MSDSKRRPGVGHRELVGPGKPAERFAAGGISRGQALWTCNCAGCSILDHEPLNPNSPRWPELGRRIFFVQGGGLKGPPA